VTSAASETLDYIQALKWPVIVLIGILLERGAISKLLGRLRLPDEGSAQIPGVGDFSWKNANQALAEATQRILERREVEPNLLLNDGDPERSTVQEAQRYQAQAPQRAPTPAPPPMSVANLYELAAGDPDGAVIAAWEQLLGVLYARAYVDKANVDDRERRDGHLMAVRLGLDYAVQSAITELGLLRNKVAHGLYRPSSEDALQYVQSVQRLAVTILGDEIALRVLR
jgi:hypothetical protein